MEWIDAACGLGRFLGHELPKGFVQIACATVCSPTASANNCCPWHALGSPPRDVNRRFPPGSPPDCALWHCPAAEKALQAPQKGASPLHRLISQASTHHDRLRQSARPACSSHACPAVCAQSRQYSLMAVFNRIHQRPDYRSRRHRPHRFPSSTAKNRPTDSLTELPNIIQYP